MQEIQIENIIFIFFKKEKCWKMQTFFEIGPRLDMPPAGQVLLISNQFIKKI